jgi:hypothetical protein
MEVIQHVLTLQLVGRSVTPCQWIDSGRLTCAPVSCAQLWHYIDGYPEDPKGLKALVSAAWTANTVHQVLICYGRTLGTTVLCGRSGMG